MGRVLCIATACFATGACLSAVLLQAEEKPKAKQKPAGGKPKEVEIDPWHRPEGSIVGKSARYYIWFEDGAWSVRSCAKVGRQFSGTITIKNGGKIKSVLPVGMRKEAAQDAWRVDGDRTKVKFQFKTGGKSDGFDMKVEGDDARIEFDLHVAEKQNANFVFLGRNEQHPGSNPFELPASPAKSNKKSTAEPKQP